MSITVKSKFYGDNMFYKVPPRTFPGGEVLVKLFGDLRNHVGDVITLVARLHNSQNIMELAMVQDAVKRMYPGVPINLFMPYTPYARQDRVCDTGEAFSLKVFANLINHLNFNQVTVVDPHSDVTGAVFNNIKIVTQLDVIIKFKKFVDRVDRTFFVAPDAGANKKISEVAKYFGHTKFIRADKKRDLATGQIKETIVYSNDLEGTDVTIIDDICDGGRTFIELAKALKAKNAGKIILYVTHGIFSQGFKPLLEGGIDEIYTTDSFNANFLGDLPKELTVFPVENLIKL